MTACTASSLQRLQQYMLFKVQSDELSATFSQQFVAASAHGLQVQSSGFIITIMITATQKSSRVRCDNKNVSHGGHELIRMSLSPEEFLDLILMHPLIRLHLYTIIKCCGGAPSPSYHFRRSKQTQQIINHFVGNLSGSPNSF